MKFQDFLNRLSHQNRSFKFQVAGTGSAYIRFGEMNIRIADHEPNFAMTKFRGTADHEIYTFDASNNRINDDLDVIHRVLEITGIELSENMQTELDQAQEEKDAFRRKMRAAAQVAQKEMEEVKIRVSDFHSQIREAIAGRENEVEDILAAAKVYGEEGSNSTKRRKRTTSFFKREFKNAFGFEATPGDLKNVNR